jgi:hypothetical protein
MAILQHKSHLEICITYNECSCATYSSTSITNVHVVLLNLPWHMSEVQSIADFRFIFSALVFAVLRLTENYEYAIVFDQPLIHVRRDFVQYTILPYLVGLITVQSRPSLVCFRNICTSNVCRAPLIPTDNLQPTLTSD